MSPRHSANEYPSLASKARGNTSASAAGQGGSPHFLSARSSSRKDIRHLNSGGCVATLLHKPCTPPWATYDVTCRPPVSSQASTDGSVSGRASSQMLECQSPLTRSAASGNDGNSCSGKAPLTKRTLLSSSDSAATLKRSASLNKMRQWSDLDAKPRMAQRISGATPRSLTSARQAREIHPAGQPSFFFSRCWPCRFLAALAGFDRSASEEPQTLSRWPNTSTPPSQKASGTSNTWADLIAEAEEVGARLQSSRQMGRSDLFRDRNSLNKHSAEVRAHARTPPAGQSTVRAASKGSQGQPGLLRSDSARSFSSPRGLSSTPRRTASLKALMSSCGVHASPRR